jgi:hypothetical protein
MNEINWFFPYTAVVILAIITVAILYLRNILIKDTIKRVCVGDIYIDPECNRINSKYIGKWMEYRVIRKTGDKIICEHYWRDSNKMVVIEPISTLVSFAHEEFFNKFKRYDI